MKKALFSVSLALAAATLPVVAQQAKHAVVLSAPATLQDLMKKPRVLRGTLGADLIQLHLQPKKEEEGWEGHYFIFGHSGQVLLVGEIDQDAWNMEESQNGQDVSGYWEGKYENGMLSGMWFKVDDSERKPFALTVGGQP